MAVRDLNKFKGCLIGGAVGDALGYAVGFPRHLLSFKNMERQVSLNTNCIMVLRKYPMIRR